VIIASFSRSSLLSVRRLDSRLKTGILLKYWPIPQPFTPPSGVDTLLPQFRNFRRIGVRRLAKSGFPVYPFTVNQPRMMQKLIDFGVTAS
jgi:glycerophosphoryl diester phosphodiesterase